MISLTAGPSADLSFGFLLAGRTGPSRVDKVVAPGIRGGFDPHVLVGTLWCFILTIVSVKEAERLPWGRSIVVAVVSSLASGILAFTYIR